MALDPNEGNLSEYLSEQNNLIEDVKDAVEAGTADAATADKQDEAKAVLEDILAAFGTKEFFSNVALGNVSGAENFKKQGSNISVGTTQIVLNYNGSTALDTIPNSVVAFVSSSANDTAAGTGARALQIFGINAAGAEQSEILVLNGTTPVNTANTYSKILNRVLVASAGAGRTNSGIITGTAAGKTQCNIPAGASLMRQLAYAVPTGKKALYYSHYFDASKNSGGTNKIDLILKVLRGGVVYTLFTFRIDLNAGNDVFLHRKFDSPMPFLAGDIWWYETKTDTSTAWLDGEVEQVIFTL